MEINLVKNRPLNEFKSGDSLYVQKIENGRIRNYHISFSHLSNGNVVGRVNYCIEGNLAGHLRQGEIITAKPSKCFLIGRNILSRQFQYYWFQDTKTGIK